MATKTKAKPMKLVTPVFRASFTQNVFTAGTVGDDPKSKPKFGLAAIWTPAKFSEGDKAKWKAILVELDKQARTAFNKPWKELPEHIRRGIRNGVEKEGLEGYGEGTRFANLTSNNRPGVVMPDGETKISPDEGNADEIYPGCYCRATVNVYSYNNKGKGVALGLRNIQKVKDGPRLDNRTDAAEDFADEELDGDWLDQDEDIEDGGNADDDEAF